MVRFVKRQDGFDVKTKAKSICVSELKDNGYLLTHSFAEHLVKNVFESAVDSGWVPYIETRFPVGLVYVVENPIVIEFKGIILQRPELFLHCRIGFTCNRSIDWGET